jgi:hypothetical protein
MLGASMLSPINKLSLGSKKLAWPDFYLSNTIQQTRLELITHTYITFNTSITNTG